MSIPFFKKYQILFYLFGVVKVPAVCAAGTLFITSNRDYTSSMTAISAASPRRAPVRVTLV